MRCQSLLLLASFCGRRKTFIWICFPWRNVVLMFSCHLWDDIVARVILIPSLKQDGESAWKHCSSSNSLAHSLAFVLCCPSIIFGLITYLIEIACWPSLATSLNTNELSHFCFIYFLAFCWLIDLAYVCFIRSVNWQVGFAYW